jgi:Flp pilus assembly protein TadD
MARTYPKDVYGTDLHRRMADYEECKRRDKARRKARANARVWLSRGRAFLMAGDIDTAEANFMQATAEIRHAR